MPLGVNRVLSSSACISFAVCNTCSSAGGATAYILVYLHQAMFLPHNDSALTHDCGVPEQQQVLRSSVPAHRDKFCRVAKHQLLPLMLVDAKDAIFSYRAHANYHMTHQECNITTVSNAVHSTRPRLSHRPALTVLAILLFAICVCLICINCLTKCMPCISAYDNSCIFTAAP